jgi:hypothetical protein
VGDVYASVSGDTWDRQGVRSDGAVFTVATIGRYHYLDVYHHLHDVAALGAAYARHWASQTVIRELGGRTPADALAAGVAPKEVWLAVWQALELPPVDR